MMRKVHAYIYDLYIIGMIVMVLWMNRWVCMSEKKDTDEDEAR